MCIVFRLAGYEEYSWAEVAPYAKDVDAHFGRFKEHPVVVRARRLRQELHLGFGDPMILATHITGVPDLAERVPLDPFPPTPASRWTPAEARAFLAELRAFVREADVAGFLAAHDALYRRAVERLEATVRQGSIAEWVDGFFGQRDDRNFVVAISLLNGSGSFGLKARGFVSSPAAGPRPAAGVEAEHLLVVLGASYTDAGGMPAFPSHQAHTLVHEFSHPMVSPVVKAHLRELLPAAEKIWAVVQKEMQRQAYGEPEAILHESLVRACAVRYAVRQAGAEGGQRAAAGERARGFLWVDRLADLLGEYEKDRAKYASLDQFVPRIAAFFDAYSREVANEVAALQAEGKAQKASAATSPKVVATTPGNDAGDVEAASVTTISVTFDRPMRDGAMAVVMVPGLAFPKVTGRPTYDATRRVLTIPCQLQAGTAYGLQLNSEANMVMADEQGNLLVPFLYRFTTKK